MCPSENAHTTNSNTNLFRRSSVDDDASNHGRPVSSTTTHIFLSTSTHPTLPMLPQAEQLSMHFTSHESPRNYLYTDLFTISYTTLDASDSYSAPSSPHFILPVRYYDPGDHNCNALSHGASFTNVPKDIKASNQIWSCHPCACVFDHFCCVAILAHL